MNRRDSLKSILLGLFAGPAILKAAPAAVAPVAAIVDEVQTVEFYGGTTEPLAWNATAAQIQAAIEKLQLEPVFELSRQ